MKTKRLRQPTLKDPGQWLLVLTIDHRHAKRILAGSQRIELRRQAPRIGTPCTALLYAKAPLREIIGSVTVDSIDILPIEQAPTAYVNYGHKLGIDSEAWDDYLAGSQQIVIPHLTTPQRLETSVTADDLPDHMRPPQSYRYYQRGEWQRLLASLNTRIGIR